MSNFFKTIIRGVMQSNHNLNKPNKFMGNLINNMAEITATATVNDQKTYFAEPLAGNLSCFYKTTDDCPNSGEENSDINRKTEQSPQVEKCSVPFMITRNMKLNLLEKGYKMDEIKQMTPKEAHEILNKK